MSGPPPSAHAPAALHWAQGLGLPRTEAQMLLLHAWGQSPHDRAWLWTHDTDPVPPAVTQTFAALCQRRAQGEPVAYVLGQREFYGLQLKVSPAVLDPRADTETLVDWALQVLHGQTQPDVIDLGTGSGAIALALQHHRRDARITAVDASAAALAVAQANAQALQLPVQCRLGDWLHDCPGPAQGWALVVSNPPYIAEGDPHLAALRHEPQQALTSGPDGLRDIRRIVAQALPALQPGGWLLLEHGHDQADAVAALLHAAGFESMQHRHDAAGHRRCTGGAAAGWA